MIPEWLFVRFLSIKKHVIGHGMMQSDFAPIIPMAIAAVIMFISVLCNASDWSGKGVNNSVWPSIILLLYLAFVLSLFYTAYKIINDYDPHLWIFSGWWGLLFYSLIGITFYKLRQRKRLLYGFIEVCVSMMTYYYVIFTQVSLEAKLIGLLSGSYLMVRGLDNMRTDFPKDGHEWWDKWIG